MKNQTYQRKIVLFVLSTTFVALLTSCTTPGWVHNPNAWRAMAEFSKPDTAPFTGAAPMRPMYPAPAK